MQTIFYGFCFSIFFLTFIWMPGICSADIYKYVDKNGVVHFTNAPNNNRYTLIIKEGRKFTRQSKQYDHIIEHLCKKYNIDMALVKAIIKAESNFDARAVSKKGAKGLMQLMPKKIEEFAVDDPYHPRDNIEAGIRYLRKLLDKFNGDIPLSVAAYNAGENAVLKYNQVPPFEETRQYVQKVLQYLRDFRTSP